jgi:hypothetical protein
LRLKAEAVSQPDHDATAWHAMASDEVLRRLDSDAQSSLDNAEVPRCLVSCPCYG